MQKKYSATTNLRHHINRHGGFTTVPGHNSSLERNEEAQRMYFTGRSLSDRQLISEKGVFRDLMRSARAHAEEVLKREQDEDEISDS